MTTASKALPDGTNRATLEAIVPSRTLRDLHDYATRRLAPGRFLGCVLANDLAGAVMLADAENYAAMRGIIVAVDRMPAECRGDWAKVSAWVEGRGR